MCVYIKAFRHQAVNLKVPRTVVTPNILGRTVGKVGDAEGQRRVIREALRLLETAESPGSIVDLQ